ncbi:MAG: flagellar basal body P-ring formation chaperone FlgA [Pirellulales bacterium]
MQATQTVQSFFQRLVDAMRFAALPAWTCCLVFALCCPSNASAAPAEEVTLRFRRDPRCDSQVVRLGDLVEVVSGGSVFSSDVLEFPLSPAPRKGVTQTWTSADVIKHLELRGLTTRPIRWSGAESTTLMYVERVQAAKDSTPMAPAFVQQRTLLQAEKNAAYAIKEYLWLKTGERTPWTIKVTVPPEHAAALYVRSNIKEVGGGEEPWYGEQEFIVGYKHQNNEGRVKLKVEVELPTLVVAAARPLRRDELIDESMLTYMPLDEKAAAQTDQYFAGIEQLIGKQVRKSFSAGQPITRLGVGAPTVISTGELIEIESIAGGVAVRTAGKALGSGAEGDAIMVETMMDRKSKLMATVIGPRQVRVLAQSVIADDARSNNRSSASKTAGSLPTPGLPGLRGTENKTAQRAGGGVIR